jgi:hypothetical protein
VTRISADELESAADRISDMSRADLQIVLRRAALMLRNVAGVPLEPATAGSLDFMAAEMGIARSDLIQIVLREWLETTAQLGHGHARDAEARKTSHWTAAGRDLVENSLQAQLV